MTAPSIALRLHRGARAAGLLLCVMLCRAVCAADLLVHVTQADGKPLPGAVVTVHPLGATLPPAAPVQAVMDQVNLAFSPDVLVIPAGSTVSFPNTDRTGHEVYSFSPTHPFKLPLYRGKPYPPEHFDRPGVVTLGCNIHDAMLAYILVTDAPYYGRTAADGSWSQPDLPRGRYRIDVWSPRLTDTNQTLQREIVVDSAEHAQAELHTQRGLRPAELSSRPHSWDAY